MSLSKEEELRAAAKMIALLDQATAAMQDDNLLLALKLIVQAHDIADTLPIKKDRRPGPHKSVEGGNV
ncbi:MAG TPA: hypothetical protein VGR63_19150 [Casimicrobiaceae bacterium]|nr:hypothetical protein [Casimicrobiaceae bacterium]